VKRLTVALMIMTALLVIITQDCNAQTSIKKKNKPKPLVTFVELGSVSCTPCKMMKPVMAEIEKAYGDTISVVFHDVSKDRQKASDYKIRVIPTQVFLDKKGKEFYRHEGFFPKEEIIKLVDKQLGIKRTK
jgi:thioredoxin 1